MVVKWERLMLKDFVYGFSLQVGVVFVCCFGILLSVTAFLKLCYNPLVEKDSGVAAGSYFIASVFILASLLVYTLGLAGSSLENSRMLKISGAILILVAVYWIILTALSFSNKCYITRYVCVDNRCTERLYVQNGYWRQPIILCVNMSGPDPRDANKIDRDASDTNPAKSNNNCVPTQPKAKPLKTTNSSTTEQDVIIINIEVAKYDEEEDVTQRKNTTHSTATRSENIRRGEEIDQVETFSLRPKPKPTDIHVPEKQSEQGKIKRALLFKETAYRAVGDEQKLNNKDDYYYDSDPSDDHITNLTLGARNKMAFNGKLLIRKNKFKSETGDKLSSRGVYKAGRAKEQPKTDEKQKTGEDYMEEPFNRALEEAKTETVQQMSPTRVSIGDGFNTPALSLDVITNKDDKLSSKSMKDAPDYSKPPFQTETPDINGGGTTDKFRPSCHTRTPATTPNHTTSGTSNHTTSETSTNERSVERIVTTDDRFAPVWTPIGKTGSTAHFVLSIVYAFLILPFWYLYPIWMMFSLAAQIDRGDVV